MALRLLHLSRCQPIGWLALFAHRQTANNAEFPSVAEFLRRCLPGSPVGAATARPPEHDRRQVLADLEAALAPWVDADGLRVVAEANTAVASR